MKPESEAQLLELLAECIASKIASKLAGKLESPKHEGPRYYTRREAKRLLGLEVRAFDRAGQELGLLKPGKMLLLPAAGLIDWIERQRVERGQPDQEPPMPRDPDAPVPFRTRGFPAKARPVELKRGRGGGQ
jgi:hypothetical protein